MNCSNGLAWASYERHRAIATAAALADRPYKWEEGGEVGVLSVHQGEGRK